jgi:tRNA threonylcarbamoyladenosine biosynthesis protein TsaB
LVGVSTLHALARGASASSGAPKAADAVMAVIDARRGEVFAAGWAAAEAGQSGATPILRPRALTPNGLAQTVSSDHRSWLAVGDGAVEFREALEHAGAWIPEPDSELNRVSAVEHCRLALALEVGPPEGVQPEYLRLPDAEINLRAARQQ